MKKALRYMRQVFAMVIGGFFMTTVSAQDIHFSQFANAPLNLSPGLAGVFGGDMRLSANYRSQWRSVPVPYSTFSIGAERKFYMPRRGFEQYLTGGLLINYDRQGSLNLTSLQIGIPIAVMVPISANNFLSAAIQPGFGQRAFGTGDISFDEQFIDCMYSSSNPFSENLVRNKISYFDLSAGLNWRFHAPNPQKRTRLDVGGSVFHINRPNHDFWPDIRPFAGEVRLHRRWGAHAVGLLQITPSIDLVGQAQLQRQGGYRQNIFGVGGRLLLNATRYQEVAVQVGVDFRQRYTDALIPHIEIFWNTWMLGLSYDINASDAQILTNNQGGLEVSVIYRTYKPKVARGCTIY